MSSVTSRVRQNNPSHFMSISSLTGASIMAYNPVAGATSFSTASWAWAPQTGNLGQLSSLSAPGALLKDIGKNIVSSNRYFRKVQLVVRNGGTTASTFGVGGAASTVWPQSDFYTGYIELGYEGGGAPAPVVQFGTL
jgi:hypothetical protein